MVWDFQCIPHKTKVYVNVKNNMLSVLPGREKNVVQPLRCGYLGKGNMICGYAQADSDLEMPLGQSLKIGKTFTFTEWRKIYFGRGRSYSFVWSLVQVDEDILNGFVNLKHKLQCITSRFLSLSVWGAWFFHMR